MPPQPLRPPELAWQVFRGSDAVRRGLLTRHQLRGASWVRLRQDVYADARLDRDHALACRAALLRLPPGTLLAGPSAAYLHGVEHAAALQDDVHVLLPSTARADAQPGVRVHQAPSSPERIGLLVSAGTLPRSVNTTTRHGPAGGSAETTPTRRGPASGAAGATSGADGGAVVLAGRARATAVGPVGGEPSPPSGPCRLPRTEPAACAWQTAVWSDPVRAVGVVDALLLMGLVSRADLADVTDRNAGRPGGRRARWVFGLADPGAQSPTESHLRVRLVLAGLPRPVAHHPVRGPSGLVLHPDLAWPEFRVAVEHDGQWRLDPDQQLRDRHRIQQLVAAGWLVLPVTDHRLHRNFPALVREVRAALVARGWRP
ncbi:endonuclease domain-containing protein [Micromonospora sp. NPDC005299]|uniref:endonuclease domain-containing protein n=1 Tax=Micromonospora sp. NPDC005299 TaxID=3364231 RepID=UPI0036912F21